LIPFTQFFFFFPPYTLGTSCFYWWLWSC